MISSGLAGLVLGVAVEATTTWKITISPKAPVVGLAIDPVTDSGAPVTKAKALSAPGVAGVIVPPE